MPVFPWLEGLRMPVDPQPMWSGRLQWTGQVPRWKMSMRPRVHRRQLRERYHTFTSAICGQKPKFFRLVSITLGQGPFNDRQRFQPWSYLFEIAALKFNCLLFFSSWLRWPDLWRTRFLRGWLLCLPSGMDWTGLLPDWPWGSAVPPGLFRSRRVRLGDTTV